MQNTKIDIANYNQLMNFSMESKDNSYYYLKKANE